MHIIFIEQNKKRWNYDYKVGQKGTEKNKGQRKMEAPTEGPFSIVHVYTNGTVALQRRLSPSKNNFQPQKGRVQYDYRLQRITFNHRREECSILLHVASSQGILTH